MEFFFEIVWEFFGRIFFGGIFFGRIFLEEFFGRNFLEGFLGGFLGGLFFLRNSLGGIIRLILLSKELICLSRFWFLSKFCLKAEKGRKEDKI